MSNSFFMDKILHETGTGVIIDAKYPCGAKYQALPTIDAFLFPKLCFAEHSFCRNHGVLGFFDAKFFLCGNLPKKRTNMKASPDVTFASKSPVVSILKSSMTSRVVAKSPTEITSNSVNRPSIFPSFIPVFKPFSETTSSYPEMAQDLTKYGSTRNDQMYIEPTRDSFMITSGAVPSTSKKSLKRNKKSSESSPEQVTNSSESNPWQATNSPKTFSGQEELSESNSNKISLFSSEQIDSVSTGFPEHVEDISRTSPINKKATFPKWQKSNLEKKTDLKPRIYVINPEAFLSFSPRFPVPIQNANIESRGKVLLFVLQFKGFKIN